MDQDWIRHIYQQWSHGNDDAMQSYIFFVGLAAKLTGKSTEIMLQELKKYAWFQWTE